jgi:hypothetical protein
MMMALMGRCRGPGRHRAVPGPGHWHHDHWHDKTYRDIMMISKTAAVQLQLFSV